MSMEHSCQKFGIDLLKCVSSKQFDDNVIYSPMSIYCALGMTLHGAHGDTLTEIMETLNWDCKNPHSRHEDISKLMTHFNESDNTAGMVKIANKLFVDQGFSLLDSFTSFIKEMYRGGVDLMDFKGQFDKSRQSINAWVEEQTNSKIKNLLTPGTVHELTKLILVNAIYFKGAWQEEFRKSGKQDFHCLNKTSKSVEMINKSSFYPYMENKTIGFRAVTIPFKRIGSCNYSMMVILPNEKCSLPALEKSLFEKEWHSVLGLNLFERQSVNITMPKFRIESSFKLKEVLQSLGMARSFSDTADFSAMTGKKDLMIDDVIHKAFIDVDEHGVEAAAATAVLMMKKCCAMVSRGDPIEFMCDHAFMFALLTNDGVPVFIGHLVKC